MCSMQCFFPVHRSLTDELTESIRLLNSLARKLKAGRMAAGALNLASPEVKIQLDSSESSDPVDVQQKELRETNSLVEEFMLLANISVARKIQETFPQTAVLRLVHTPPSHIMLLQAKDLPTGDTCHPLEQILRSYRTSCESGRGCHLTSQARARSLHRSTSVL